MAEVTTMICPFVFNSSGIAALRGQVQQEALQEGKLQCVLDDAQRATDVHLLSVPPVHDVLLMEV